MKRHAMAFTVGPRTGCDRRKAGMTATEVIRRLGLVPLEFEGGWFREMWRDASSTAICYLLTSDTRSRLHRLPKAETWHFYTGDPVTLLLLHPGGTSEVVVLGPDIGRGQQPQKTVPAGTWQGAFIEEKSEGKRQSAEGKMANGQERRAEGEHWALMGTTVAPPFERSDFESGRRAELLKGWPQQEAVILRLTDGG